MSDVVRPSDVVRRRRVFSDEFKRDAVRLAKERGNIEQTARGCVYKKGAQEGARRLSGA